jgi:predicted 3-demethylubiquinone-9 3-methyltransferase (glyoxalase superfamily)
VHTDFSASIAQSTTKKENDGMSAKQKIVTFLWFDNNAEEAIHYYVSIFKNSKIVSLSRHGEAGPGPKGTMLAGTFELEGQRFMALNGGPIFKFTEAISLFVNCESQEEVDDLWEKLPPAEARIAVDGSKTSSGCLGKSSPPRWARC